jgi:hypothetical protein
MERSSVRKMPNANASNGHESARKLERASSRKMERASQPGHERPSQAGTKAEVGHSSNGHIKKADRGSKADLSAAAGAAKEPKAEKPRRSWKKELFRAMVDALRDILRYERRSP